MASSSNVTSDDDDFDSEYKEIMAEYGIAITDVQWTWQETEQVQQVQQVQVASEEDDSYELELEGDEEVEDDDDDDSDYKEEDDVPDDTVNVYDETEGTPRKVDASQRDVIARDRKEREMEEKLFGKNASKCCTRKCNAKIPRELAVNTRQCFAKLAKKEQDLVIIAHLQCHQRTPELGSYYGAETKRGRVRVRTSTGSFVRSIRYFHSGMEICRAFYFFLYNLGTQRLKNLIQHFRKNALSIRHHGSTGKRSTNKQVFSLQKRQHEASTRKNLSER